MFRFTRERAPEGGRALDGETAPAGLMPDRELSEDALDRVVAGLERIYVYDPETEQAAPMHE
ncbi:MAG TPA: hypothetical protein VJT67_02110 [Longimicrobiaceae bacterium]|nr:hypothetical protein [Longimicrobiaceae bacterium]